MAETTLPKSHWSKQGKAHTNIKLPLLLLGKNCIYVCDIKP